MAETESEDKVSDDVMLLSAVASDLLGVDFLRCSAVLFKVDVTIWSLRFLTALIEHIFDLTDIFFSELSPLHGDFLENHVVLSERAGLV